MVSLSYRKDWKQEDTADLAPSKGNKIHPT